MDSAWGTKPPALVLQLQKNQHHQEHKWMSRVPRWRWTRWAVKEQRITMTMLSPSDTSTITPERSNYFPVPTHKFRYCSAHISPLRECRNREDIEIEEARLREQGRYGWRMEGKNEKERLVFMPGSQRACKSPRSVVEDSRRLIVIHHSWQPHRSGRAWQHSPVWEERRGGETRRKINRKGCCLQNVQINSSVFKAGLVENNKVRRQMWGREGAVGCYCRSGRPWVSVCGNSRAAAGGQRGNCLVYLPAPFWLIRTCTHSNQNNLLNVCGFLQACPPSMSSIGSKLGPVLENKPGRFHFLHALIGLCHISFVRTCLFITDSSLSFVVVKVFF